VTQPIDFEYYFKCLLVMNHRGVYLYGADGHIWIGNDPEAEYPWSVILINAGVELNNKIYGGVLEAIDTFDAAVQSAGQPSLIEQYGDWLFFGRRGVDASRIYRGNGGIV